MSILAIRGVPMKLPLAKTVRMLAHVIKGSFEALSFENARNHKICYIRLSARLDPKEVIEQINGSKWSNKADFHAYIPDKKEIPIPKKTKKIPSSLRKILKIPPNFTNDQLVIYTHEQIMRELQSKYTGLYELSRKTGHKLLNAIGQTVSERLRQILTAGWNIDSCFNLSRLYRKSHPHFADFQFILSTLHTLQDTEGKQRDQIQESELLTSGINANPTDNLPHARVTQAYNKYAEKIIHKLQEHLNNLKPEIDPDNDPQQETAKVKVQTHMKKMVPYIPSIVKEIVNRHNVNPKQTYRPIRIYGEPFLPNKDVMGPHMRRFGSLSASRSETMYNLLVVRVPLETYSKVLATDGELVGGAKLVIRPSDLPFYKVMLCSKTGLNVVSSQEAPNEGEDWNDEW